MPVPELFSSVGLIRDMQHGISLSICLLFLLAGAAFPHKGGKSGLILKSLPQARIEIWKEARILKLYSADHLVRQYRIGLGFAPVGQKTREGDGATPEGIYHVCVKNPQSRYFLSLGLSYPNSGDAARGVAAGLITDREKEDIVSVEHNGVCPPWDTALGGEIYIHGKGSSTDWTLGCIALDDADMQEVYAAVRIGSKVIIHP